MGLFRSIQEGVRWDWVRGLGMWYEERETRLGRLLFMEGGFIKCIQLWMKVGWMSIFLLFLSRKHNLYAYTIIVRSEANN